MRSIALVGLMACVVSTHGMHLSPRPMGRKLACHALRMNVGQEDTYETSEVVLAARKGKASLLAELLAADTSEANKPVRCGKIATMDGATPIIWASRQGKSDAVQILIDAGADVNAAAGSGWTALYAAALNGHEDIVALLVNSGASVKVTMGLGDERTNLNLRRMLEEVGLEAATPAALQQQPMSASPPFAAAPPAPAPAPAPALAPASATETVPSQQQPAVDPSDWKAVARSAVQPSSSSSSSSSSEGALAGMGELDAMKLRLEWRAPPTAEEQAAAEAARQTVFKYRHDRIKELEAAIATGRVGASLAGSPGSSTPPPSPSASAAIAPPAAQRPPEGAVAVDASLLARLESLEATLNAMGGFESGSSKGFAEGFAAGRAAE